jgi:hypothetical protein
MQLVKSWRWPTTIVPGPTRRWMYPATRPRYAQRTASAEAGGELAAQGSPALHVQRLVYGLVADAHRRVLGKIEPQAARDLLRAPRATPPSDLSAAVPTPLPRYVRPGDRGSVRSDDHAGQSVLHVGPQRRIHGQACGLRATGYPIGVPLRGRGTVIEPAAARGGVPPQLPRDRGCGPRHEARDLPYSMPLRAKDCEILPLRERQIPTGPRRRCRGEV